MTLEVGIENNFLRLKGRMRNQHEKLKVCVLNKVEY